MRRRPPISVPHQSPGTFHCQRDAGSRVHDQSRPRLAVGVKSRSEGVQSVGNENSDAKNNKGCNYSFKHRRILRNRFTKRSTSCIVKEILLSVMNFPPHDDFEQHPTHARRRHHRRVYEACARPPLERIQGPRLREPGCDQQGRCPAPDALI